MYQPIRKILWILFCIPHLCAAEVMMKQGADSPGMENPLSLSYVIQILISFLAVVIFIFLLAWLMRKTGRFGSGSGQTIKIISSMSLGMREKIMILNVGGENIVVGIAPGQIRTLHVLNSEIDINKQDEENNINRRGFKQLLDKLSK